MGCKCHWLETIVAVVVFVLALWPGIIGATASKWVLVIAAVVLFIHAMMCKNCRTCSTDMAKSSGKKKKRR